MLLSLENPPLCFVNLLPPKITPSVQRLSKTKFTKCVALKTNKRRTNNSYLWCLFMFRRQSCVLFLYVPPFSLFSLQLARRAPSSHSRGQDYVSNVRSTVAPPSRPPPCVVVGTATTAETWTNRRTCARVSQSLYVRQIQNTEIHKPLSSVAECDRATGRL